MSSRPFNIYIFAGDIAYNRGDLGSIYSHIQLLKSNFSDIQITTHSLNSRKHAQWLNISIIKQSIGINIQQWRALRKADLVVWGGGACIADHSCKLLIPYSTWMIFLIRFILRKKIVAVSHGITLETTLGKWLAKRVYGWVDAIGCRDENSLNTLKQLNISTPMHLTGDYALLLQQAPRLSPALLTNIKRNTKRPTIGISVTFWHLYNGPNNLLPYMFRSAAHRYHGNNKAMMEQLKAGLTTLVSTLCSQYDADIVLIPRYTHDKSYDIQHLMDVREQCQKPEHVMVLTQDEIHPAEYPKLLDEYMAIISIPLHDSIFAALGRTPFLALYYEPKCEDFMRSIHAEDRSLSWTLLMNDHGIQEITQALATTIEQWGVLQPQQAAAMKLLQSRAYNNIKLIKEQLNRP